MDAQVKPGSFRQMRKASSTLPANCYDSLPSQERYCPCRAPFGLHVTLWEAKRKNHWVNRNIAWPWKLGESNWQDKPQLASIHLLLKESNHFDPFHQSHWAVAACARCARMSPLRRRSPEERRRCRASADMLDVSLCRCWAVQRQS